MNVKKIISSMIVFSALTVSSITSVQAINGSSEAQAVSVESVTVYSSRKEHLIKPLFEAFTKDTGIKVEYLTGKGGALIERLKLEGDNTQADMFMTVDAGNLWYAGSQDLFQSVQTETIKSNIPAHLRDPKGLWTGLSVRARTIVYSTDRVKEQDLSTYANLATNNVTCFIFSLIVNHRSN